MKSSFNLKKLSYLEYIYIKDLLLILTIKYFDKNEYDLLHKCFKELYDNTNWIDLFKEEHKYIYFEDYLCDRLAELTDTYNREQQDKLFAHLEEYYKGVNKHLLILGKIFRNEINDEDFKLEITVEELEKKN